MTRLVVLLVAASFFGACGGTASAPEWTAELRSNAASDARASFFDGWQQGPGSEDPLTVERLAMAGTPERIGDVLRVPWSGGAATTEMLAQGRDAAAWRAGWARIDGRDLHTWEVEVPTGSAGVVTLEHVRFFGRTPDGRAREDRFRVRLSFAGDGETWRVERAELVDGETLVGPRAAFSDVTDAVLPPGYDQVGARMYTDAGPSLADADGDGDIDFFLPRMHAPARLYLNDGGIFDDATERSGLALQALSQGTNAALFVDLDLDGDLDLVVADADAGIHLLTREGARYRAHANSPFAGPGPWESLASADADGDGRPDVFASAYGTIDTERQPDSYVDARNGAPSVLLRSDEALGFEDVTEASGLAPHAGRWTYGAAWADWDRDGDADLYLANDYGPNALLRNDGGRFVDVAAAVGAEDRGNGMGVSWFDADGDGILDLYVSNMQSFAGNRITRSPGFPGTPEQVALYARFAQGNSLLRGRPDGTFEDVTVASGTKPAYWAWGSVPFDHDGDGDQDLLCVTGMYTGPTSGDT